MGNNPDITHGTLYCDFCGKSQHEVRKLIAGPRVMICDGCVLTCLDMLVSAGKPESMFSAPIADETTIRAEV